MNKLIHVILVIVFSSLGLSLEAQTETMQDSWDDLDFSDTSLVSSKMLSDRLVEFFFSFTDGNEQRFDSLSVEGLKVVLGKSKVNMRVYEYILEFALNGYANLGRDKVTDFLLNYPQLAEGEIAIEEGLRLDSITEPYQKVRVGAKAPDFLGVTIDGNTYGIYESASQHIIVVFWSIDCDYCHDFLNQIRRKLDLRSDFELVTFALADNQEEVIGEVRKMHLPGYHFYDELGWEGKAFLEYHIFSTPTVFVLDADKTIVCKPYDWNDLKCWLRKNN